MDQALDMDQEESADLDTVLDECLRLNKDHANDLDQECDLARCPEAAFIFVIIFIIVLIS